MGTGCGTFGNARHAIMPLRPAPLMRLWLHSREHARSQRGRSDFHKITLIRRPLLPVGRKDPDLPTGFNIYPKLLARVGSGRTSPISHLAHSNLRSLQRDPVSRTRISHIGSSHQGQRGRSATNTIEFKAKSVRGMVRSHNRKAVLTSCRGCCSDRAERHPCRRYCLIVKLANCGFV